MHSFILYNMHFRYSSDMDLHITGLGPLSAAAPGVAAWARGGGAAHAAPALTRALRREAQLALGELPLWDMLHGKH